MLTNFNNRGNTRHVVRRFKRFTRLSEGGKLWINTAHTGKAPIESIHRTAVDSVRNAVEVRGRFAARGLITGNQLRRWHGTIRNCNVGENGRTSLCYSSQCSLCCIIKTSFDVAYSGKNTGWGRFGNGIYTSSASSKFVGFTSSSKFALILVSRSNDYSYNRVSSPWKALLLACVVVGNPKTFTTDRPTLTQPPGGFDSVRSISSSPFKLFL